MYVVTFPSIIETFYRALNEVLAPFLTTGQTQMLMRTPVQFYKCDLFFNKNVFAKEPQPNPFICFTGERVGPRTDQKCNDPKGNMPFAYEVRQTVYRTVFVGIGASKVFNHPPYLDPESPRQADMMDAEVIWSQLLMVLEHQYANLALRGIHTPILPAVPAQILNKDYFLLQGELKTEIRFTMTRGN
jgi:hypothetical protein